MATFEPKAKELFKKLDKDGNGTLDSREWGSAIGKLHDEMKEAVGGDSKKETGKLWHVIDENSDGKITLEEYLKMVEANALKKICSGVDLLLDAGTDAAAKGVAKD